MRLLHEFEDGWTIRYIESYDDLEAENEEVHQGYACLTSGSWERQISDGEMILCSLVNPDGERRATLLWGDSQFILEARAGSNYVPYSSAMAFDQKPRLVNGKSAISLQCCPVGYIGGDVGETMDETKRVKKWWENLPLDENYAGWNCEDNYRTRTEAQTFLRSQNSCIN